MQVPDTAPFSDEQRAILNQLLPGMTPSQLQWLTGFVAGVESALQQPTMAPSSALAHVEAEAVAVLPSPPLAAPVPSNGKPQPASAPQSAPAEPVTILFGSESGNAEALAQETKRTASKRGFKPVVKDMAEYSPDELTKEKNLLVITSTWGDGDPPENAIELHSSMMSGNAPRLDGIRYSVCALGDTSYEKFCQTGKDFDRRLEELGGVRIHDRTDCDLDFEAPFQNWLEGVLHQLQPAAPASAPAGSPQPAATPATAASVEASPIPEKSPFGKSNPFPALLQEKILLNGRGSQKEVWHHELSLAESGLSYLPGDSLAVIPVNAPEVVEELLQAGRFDHGSIAIEGGSQLSLGAGLQRFYDITTLSKSVLSKYNALAKSKKLDRILQNSDELKAYLHGRQIVDLLEDYPIKGLTATDFIGILRKMPPRLYSIASSLSAHPDEVHLTVAAVRYDTHGRQRKGVASTYLADLVETGDSVPVYLAPNKNFKLPSDPAAPMIMVGPGTGIAPFRAFLQERQATGASGKNWLFFGDQHYTTDFLYQLEWQDYLKDGVLSNLEVAFSRDQKHKIYVQQRIEEHGAELWSWLQEGAYFYVCGDSSRMAPDVHEALLSLAEKHGGLNREDAEAFVAQMRKEKRYQRDVY